MRLGAGLAYYALFAVIPVLTLAVWVASVAVSRSEIEDAIGQAVDGLLGDASDSVAIALGEALDTTASRTGLGLAGFGSLLIAGSLFFVAVQDTLNLIWDVPVRRGVRPTLWRRLLAFVIVLLVGAYLLVAMLVSSIEDFLQDLVSGSHGAVDHVLDGAETLAFWALAVVALAAMYRVLAPVPLAWRHVFLGASVTAVLIVVGSWLTGLYLNHFATVSVTGVAGSALLLLVWFYYEAQLVLVGAELIKVLDRRAAHDEAIGD